MRSPLPHGKGHLPWRFARSAVLAVALTALSSTAAVADEPGAKQGDSRVSAKILRGQVDRRTDNQWITAILRKGPGSPADRHFCGGSLVARNYVLTAAHCVTDPLGGVAPASSLETLHGTKDLTSGGTVRNVSAVYVYPGYSPVTNYGDMALLKLSARVNYPRIGLVPTGRQYANDNYMNRRGYVAGWGDRAPYNSPFGDFPNQLHSAWIQIVPDQKCARRGTANPDPDYNGDVMICAGYARGRPDTCRGDSGGPLAGRIGGRWQLIGVTSYGKPGCGSRNTYGVYAWVGSPILKSWLQRRLGLCTITRGAGHSVIRGTPGNDVICAGSGNDTVYGLGGDDVIIGGSGNDRLSGGDGHDRLIGGSGNDRLIGGAGNDTLHGTLGNDTLDVRDGTRGNDRANGGAGDDSCSADPRDVVRSC